MFDPEKDNVAAGWNADHTSRWIEAGCLRFEEEKDGASVRVSTWRRGARDQVVLRYLSPTELAGLARELASWFTDDPTATIERIEKRATHVKKQLDIWDAQARLDEVHPPYDRLTNALEALLADCRILREDIGKFCDNNDQASADTGERCT